MQNIAVYLDKVKTRADWSVVDFKKKKKPIRLPYEELYIH